VVVKDKGTVGFAEKEEEEDVKDDK